MALLTLVKWNKTWAISHQEGPQDDGVESKHIFGQNLYPLVNRNERQKSRSTYWKLCDEMNTIAWLNKYRKQWRIDDYRMAQNVTANKKANLRVWCGGRPKISKHRTLHVYNDGLDGLPISRTLKKVKPPSGGRSGPMTVPLDRIFCRKHIHRNLKGIRRTWKKISSTTPEWEKNPIHSMDSRE